MSDVKIMPLTVNLVGTFFRSSRDARWRARSARNARSDHDTKELNIFTHRQPETQASLESIVFSFLTLEAAINYVFFTTGYSHTPPTGMERWLHGKWKSLRVYDRFVLLATNYAPLSEFQSLVTLFEEFTTLRNRIVHSYPDRYDALVEQSSTPDEVLIHDVEHVAHSKTTSQSGLSVEIGRINVEDAERGFEIMLLILCFLDEQFVADLEFHWPINDFPDGQGTHLKPKAILASLKHRYYSNIDPESFTPEFIKKLKTQQA